MGLRFGPCSQPTRCYASAEIALNSVFAVRPKLEISGLAAGGKLDFQVLRPQQIGLKATGPTIQLMSIVPK